MTGALLQDLFDSTARGSLPDLYGPSWKKLQEVGLPDKTKEAFGYFPLLKLYEALGKKYPSLETSVEPIEVESLVLPECRDSCLVFVDGVFSMEHSRRRNIVESVQILPLEQALRGSYGTFLKHRMQMWLQQEEDPFSLLNGTLCLGGVFLYIPPKVVLQHPIQLLCIQTKEAPRFSHPRVHVFAGSQSQVSLVRTIEGGESGSFYNGFLDVAVEDRAVVSLVDSSGKGHKLWGFESVRATLKKEAVFRSILATFGSEAMRHDYRVSLLGEGADASLVGIAGVLPGNQSHVHIHMDHSAPHCRSNQLFKNALLARAKASFTGKIYVKRAAQKTMAYQLNKNLLLEETAFVYSKPNLEIFADDVKASHGSTTAQLDSAQKQYLQMRGITAQEASALLTQGFFQEVLLDIQPASLRHKLQAQYKTL